VSIDLNSLATWSYDTGTLRKLSAPTGEVTIDIAANPALHTILSAQHWLNLGSKTVYSDDPADWVERRIKWNRVTEDPPVLQIEQNIGAADYVDYNVYLLEDAPDYADIFQAMADALNDGVLNGFTNAHIRSLLKNMVKAMQKFGLIGGNGV
jgi:hypothetical protein